VGNLERYQGIDLLLDCLATPAAKDARLVVIGGQPSHVAQYRQRAQALGVGERVTFLGPRPVSLLPRYLAQADVLVSPRILGQNTPMKIYSYMQAGKAILATDIRSHTQALDSTCAELVAPCAEALGQGLQRLIEDSQLRRRLGDSARAKVESQFSLSTFQHRLRHGYSKLLTA
jgi:glycosyltransferase involved in cell wall biosynthesis